MSNKEEIDTRKRALASSKVLANKLALDLTVLQKRISARKIQIGRAGGGLQDFRRRRRARKSHDLDQKIKHHNIHIVRPLARQLLKSIDVAAKLGGVNLRGVTSISRLAAILS